MTELKLCAAYLTRATQFFARSTAGDLHLPEDAVPNLIHLPRAYERDVARDGGLQYVSPSVDLARLLRDTRYLHALRRTTRVIAHGDHASFDRRIRTRGRIEGGNTSGV